MAPRGAKVKKNRLSKSVKAGTVFPVSRMHRYLKNYTHHQRISCGTSIYLTAVCEYLTAEILELAGNAAKDNKRARITPRHILLAIANDEELHCLLRDVTISQGGVLPRIHPELVRPRKKHITTLNNCSVAPKISSRSLSPTRAKNSVPKAHIQNVNVTKTKNSKKTAIYVKKTDVKVKKPNVNVTVLSEKILFLGQKLTIIQGNIIDVSADGIVHPTNDSFYMGGQVGQALEETGGQEFLDEIQKLKKTDTPLKKCEAAVCPAHNIRAKFVIHCNGPNYSGSSSQEELQKTIKSCLHLADKQNLKSLALPSVGSGKAGFPKDVAAKIILDAISEYFVNVMTSSLKQIYFVLFDMESIGIYTRELSKLNA